MLANTWNLVCVASVVTRALRGRASGRLSSMLTVGRVAMYSRACGDTDRGSRAPRARPGPWTYIVIDCHRAGNIGRLGLRAADVDTTTRSTSRGRGGLGVCRVHQGDVNAPSRRRRLLDDLRCSIATTAQFDRE